MEDYCTDVEEVCKGVDIVANGLCHASHAITRFVTIFYPCDDVILW